MFLCFNRLFLGEEVISLSADFSVSTTEYRNSLYQ